MDGSERLGTKPACLYPEAGKLHGASLLTGNRKSLGITGTQQCEIPTLDRVYYETKKRVFFEITAR